MKRAVTFFARGDRSAGSMYRLIEQESHFQADVGSGQPHRLQVARVSKTFGPARVLRDIGLSIAPGELPAFLERSPVSVVGLMTMPPFASDPEASRPHFAALRDLAAAHGLHHLSMGTSQDYAVAAAEGATIVRVGTSLFRDRG